MFRSLSVICFLVLAPLLCAAQKDPCRKIKRNTENGHITYRSPDLKSVSVIKQFKDDTVFVLHLHFKDVNQHFDTYGALVEFADGTVLRNENAKVSCVQEMSQVNLGPSTSNVGGYLLQGFFPLIDENLQHFVAKKITKVQLHNAMREVSEKDASAIQNYIICMYDLNGAD